MSSLIGKSIGLKAGEDTLTGDEPMIMKKIQKRLGVTQSHFRAKMQQMARTNPEAYFLLRDEQREEIEKKVTKLAKEVADSFAVVGLDDDDAIDEGLAMAGKYREALLKQWAITFGVGNDKLKSNLEGYIKK